nr:MAG TPA: hypothetical protein [Caudoviricetes sp.]
MDSPKLATLFHACIKNLKFKHENCRFSALNPIYE